MPPVVTAHLGRPQALCLPPSTGKEMKYIKPILRAAEKTCKVFQANPNGADKVCRLIFAMLGTVVVLAVLETVRCVFG